MTNEWEEFCCYTRPPVYASAGKNDRSYLGRFTFEMFLDCVWLTRVLTILARGYLFHGDDGMLLSGEPRERLERTRRALCAWCSVPGKTAQKDEWINETDFAELHGEFPELVDDLGQGWYCCHVHGVVKFVESNPDAVTGGVLENCRKLKSGFDGMWRKKLIQYQIPLFAPTTKAQWGLTFTEILAAALEAGPLRKEKNELPPALLERLEALRPKGISKKLDVIPTLVAYYIANRQDDTDWVVLPVVNFDAYFGTASFGKKYLTLIPPEIMERSQSGGGISRYRVLPEFLPE